MDNPIAPVEATTPVAPIAPSAEDTEWDSALDNFAPGLNKEVKKDEPVDPNKDAKTPEAPKIPEDETPEQKVAREAQEASDAEGEQTEPDTRGRDARITARESAQATEAVKTDVRARMFENVPQVLQDADGDPIKSIEDVMKLMNPRTSQPFTEEEAGTWLLSAQQQFNQRMADMEKQIDQIAEVNVDLKDQADSINYRYGELLKAMPELRDELWLKYSESLVKDPATNIITGAPMSIESFYEIALRPYIKLAESLEAQEAAKVTAEADAKRVNTRNDRSDIYGPNQPDAMDAEDKEWADAGKSYFGK